MSPRKPLFSIIVYSSLFLLSLLLPWWLAVPMLLIPLSFLRLNVLAIPAGLAFDILYGHALTGFPYHTFRYTLVLLIGVAIAALLKKILRL